MANFNQWLQNNGITHNLLFVVVGGNTYEVKDALKEQGARYIKGLGWYFNEEQAKEVKLEAPYELFQVKTTDVIEDFNPYGYGCPYIKDEWTKKIKDLCKEKKDTEEPAEVADSTFYEGEIGQRIRKIPVVLKSSRIISTDWGSTNLYTFEDGTHIFVWFTQSDIGLCFGIGAELTLSGTIKDFKEYNDVKQTILSRCIIKERE